MGKQSQQSRRALRLRFHISLLAIDISCIFVSFLLAFLIYPVNLDQLIMMNVSVIPVYVFAAVAQRAYSVSAANNVFAGIFRSIQALLSSSAAILFTAFILKYSEGFSRVIFCLGFVLAATALIVTRFTFLHRSKLLKGGDPFTIGLITEDLKYDDFDHYTTVIDASHYDVSLDSPKMYNELALALRNLDRVIVNCHPDRRLAWAHALQGANVSAEILAPELLNMAPVGLRWYRTVPTVVVAHGPLGLYDRFTKRVFDASIALLSLIVLSPLFAMVMIAIKLESAGPVFFVQERIGRSNRIFKILKFRSMRVEQSDSSGNQSTLRADDRITKVGRFIRAVSVDELPQLINVLRGEMSIVGPRPHALGSRAEGRLFWEIDRRYWHRHAAKPGLTGLAQIRGYRGSTTLESDLINRLGADLEYLQSWSLWLDLKIILMTFGVIVHRNAY